MGPNQTSRLLHNKGNHKQDEKIGLRLGDKTFAKDTTDK